MTLRLLVVTVIFLGLSERSALAGSGPAKLSCEPKARETSTVSLKGLIPESEHMLNLTLSDGTASIQVTDEDADVHLVEALVQRVFTMIIESRTPHSGDITLYAIPKTVKAKIGVHSTRATFDAVMRAPNPQFKGVVRSASDMLFGLQLSCTYGYAI